MYTLVFLLIYQEHYLECTWEVALLQKPLQVLLEEIIDYGIKDGTG